MNSILRVGLMVVGLAFAVLGWSGESSRKKVLIMGVDGTRPDALAVAHTPNLDALKAHGAFTDRAVTDPVTHSAACWSSMFCGVWGDKHGVQDPGNSFSSNRFSLYPNFFRRLERANPALNTVTFARWAPVTNATTGADLMQAFSSDAAITSATIDHLRGADPDVMFMIFLDVDSAGHSYGFRPGATNYVRAIEAADARIGSIMNALTNRPSYSGEDWLVVVLSDHGAHDGTVPETRLTFQVISGPSAARGVLYPTPSIVDICATVLTHMGVAIDPAWDLDARVVGLPAPPLHYGTNLIYNGNAESNSSTNYYWPNRGIAWWADYSGVTLGRYGAIPTFPSATTPGPPDRGANFFLGGANATGSMTQTTDLAPFAADIDDPGVDYALAGWFGGMGSQNDNLQLTARFLDGTGSILGSQSVGAVTAAERGSQTALVERHAVARVPPGTRLVELVLGADASAGPNDGLADNLSLVLTPQPDPPMMISAAETAPGTWSVMLASRLNRVYDLERSDDLRVWVTIAPGIPGSGGPLRMTDPQPPHPQAFYRVSSRRP